MCGVWKWAVRKTCCTPRLFMRAPRRYAQLHGWHSRGSRLGVWEPGGWGGYIRHVITGSPTNLCTAVCRGRATHAAWLPLRGDAACNLPRVSPQPSVIAGWLDGPWMSPRLRNGVVSWIRPPKPRATKGGGGGQNIWAAQPPKRREGADGGPEAGGPTKYLGPHRFPLQTSSSSPRARHATKSVKERPATRKGVHQRSGSGILRNRDKGHSTVRFRPAASAAAAFVPGHKSRRVVVRPAPCGVEWVGSSAVR